MEDDRHGGQLRAYLTANNTVKNAVTRSTSFADLIGVNLPESKFSQKNNVLVPPLLENVVEDIDPNMDGKNSYLKEDEFRGYTDNRNYVEEHKNSAGYREPQAVEMPVRENRADNVRQTEFLRKALNLGNRGENYPQQSLEPAGNYFQSGNRIHEEIGGGTMEILMNSKTVTLQIVENNKDQIGERSIGHRTLIRDSQRLPTFSETDCEDPNIFIKKLSFECSKYDITEDEWVSLARAEMKGDAAQWAGLFGLANIRWEFFVNRFFGRFDNPEIKAKLTSKLYGKPQGDSERVDHFIIEKLPLANRLIPGCPEKVVLKLISELVAPHIRAYLRGISVKVLNSLFNYVAESKRI
ncbi:hypothetical protein JTB14_019603 [Gonioctena quinquepunctata]|nr:hypothetical protein JTB14_019603 [Gonioctena quinquepunctata]